MDNQHRQISGYRELSQAEIDLINKAKALGNQVGELIGEIGSLEGVDQRALAIARTELQTGQMWLIRAIAKPAGF